MSSRAEAAVGRALDRRRRDAVDEVERILAAAVEVTERVAPQPPRVRDIVAAAGVSNKTFYRYFPGKSDLIAAVMERGVGIVCSYLEHRMAKETSPARAVAAWIEGMLVQVADPEMARASWAVDLQWESLADTGMADVELARPLRDLLCEPVAGLGTADPERDVDLVFVTVLGVLRRSLGLRIRPGADDVSHVVSFCLRGLGVELGS